MIEWLLYKQHFSYSKNHLVIPNVIARDRNEVKICMSQLKKIKNIDF